MDALTILKIERAMREGDNQRAMYLIGKDIEEKEERMEHSKYDIHDDIVKYREAK